MAVGGAGRGGDTVSGLHHGGDLAGAARRWGIPEADWLDLSTGISPWPWPVPQPIPPRLFERLPYPCGQLAAAARDYYGAASLLPLAGSQAAIQALPALHPAGRVGLPDIGYAEHAAAWMRAGHEPIRYPHDAHLPDWLAHHAVQALVVINPNNPSGQLHPREALLECRHLLAARGGLLVVDEAFADAAPETSLAAHSGQPGLVVLRSLGKFFGLAGLRVGFALAQPTLLEALQAALGPWTLSGPSQWLAARALADRDWQLQARARLRDARAVMSSLLEHAPGAAGMRGTALFTTLAPGPAEAARLHDALARCGILTRLFASEGLLRFGHVDEAGLQRLHLALQVTARSPG